MNLTPEKRRMLEGEYGYTIQKAMEILVGLGECYDAAEFIPIQSAHLSANNPVSVGDSGIRFIRELAEKGGRFLVFTDTNPITVLPQKFREIPFQEEWSQKQKTILDIYAKMGAFPANTCTPYLIGHLPQFGQHVAWSESSATVFANSVLGAKTNREGGPSAIAAALIGETPAYGMHLAEKRLGSIEISVQMGLKGVADFGTLGYFAGNLAQDGIPVFTGITSPVSLGELKMLSAACATAGSVNMFHIVGLTPEAPSLEAVSKNKKKGLESVQFDKKQLRKTEEILSSAETSDVDLVIFGCPHCSIQEISCIASFLDGKKINTKVMFWILTSEIIKGYARHTGLLDIIEGAGGMVIGDGCQNILPAGFFKSQGVRNIATNSAKLSYYQCNLQNMHVHYGSTQRCINAAINGIWR